MLTAACEFSIVYSWQPEKGRCARVVKGLDLNRYVGLLGYDCHQVRIACAGSNPVDGVPFVFVAILYFFWNFFGVWEAA